MSFIHNPRFDAQFDKVPNIIWTPYVGQNFEQSPQKLLVFAHNISCKGAEYDAKTEEWKAKNTWSSCLDEYTYKPVKYNKAFRFFIKAAVGLSGNYKEDPIPAIRDKIESFVNRIAYVNFIQGLVKSETPLTPVEASQIAQSKTINKQLLEILGITHCICWGGPVFDHVTTLDGFSVVKTEDLLQKSFSYSLIQNEHGRRMHVLKIFHPSMPQGFKPYSPTTQDIIAAFLKKPNS